MDPLSELQDDLNLDDTSQALNQLKLASIDEKNWPSDEMPDFPKSGGHHWIPGSHWHLRREDPLSAEGRLQEGSMGTSWGRNYKLYGGRGVGGAKEHKSQGEHCASPPDYPLTLPCSSDDSKSSSPEPVTHLKWDDPYYDIARHQIVEVAGEDTSTAPFPS